MRILAPVYKYTLLLLLLCLINGVASVWALPHISEIKGRFTDFPISGQYTRGEWSRQIVTEEMFKESTQVFQEAVLAAGMVAYRNSKDELIAHGSGFYMGNFNGHHVVATNNHVMDSQKTCSSARFEMTGMDAVFFCDKFLGGWKEIDLAFFSINTSDLRTLHKLDDLGGMKFDFDARIYRGQELLTVGYGIEGNMGQKLTAVQDDECKVFSGNQEFLQIKDPDTIEPTKTNVWSFAHACDISHGDSGSMMLDRKTGDVLGIVWTGKFPVDPKFNSPDHLQTLLGMNMHLSETWTELNYAVPAPKIVQVLARSLLEDTFLDNDNFETMRQIVGY